MADRAPGLTVSLRPTDHERRLLVRERRHRRADAEEVLLVVEADPSFLHRAANLARLNERPGPHGIQDAPGPSHDVFREARSSQTPVTSGAAARLEHERRC